MKKLKPILPDEFVHKLQTQQNSNSVDYLDYFKKPIEDAINYAIGPYCWFIPDNRAMKIIAVSDNIRQLTPYTKDEWVGQDPSFLANNVHPDDSNYFLAAIAKSAKIHESRPMDLREKIRVNIYCRMLDSKSNYRWMLIQFVARFYNEAGRIESTLGQMTDLSAFNMIDKPMITVIDNSNKESQYFKVSIDNQKLLPISLPQITKREQEIIQLMIKGLNTPEISTVLNISYHTVENHKRNLRAKTGTKTSAELVHFIMANNLL